MVEKKVDDHTGDRNIHPERKGPACDATMLRHTHAQAVAHGEDGHWHDGDGEDRVRNQNREVDRADRPGAGEVRDDAVPQVESEDVAEEEEERRGARGGHEATM